MSMSSDRESFLFPSYLVEKKKAEVVGQTPTKQKQMNKKIERYDESLKAANKDMSFNKMKSMFGVGITMIALFGFLGSV